MTEPSEILAAIAALEAEGLQIGKRSRAHKAIEAARRACTIDRATARTSARDSLKSAIKADDSAGIESALQAVAAHAPHASQLNDELAAVRRELAAEAVVVLLPDAFSFAAEKYNAAGAALQDALAACDPLANPDAVTSMTDEQVKAWASLSEMNAHVDKAAARLRDTLALSGSKANLRNAEALHALCLDGGDVAKVRAVLDYRKPDPAAPNRPKPSHLDRLMQSRAGRWGAIYLYADAGLRCTLASAADYAVRVKERAQLVKAQAAEKAKAAEAKQVVGSHGC